MRWISCALLILTITLGWIAPSPIFGQAAAPESEAITNARLRGVKYLKSKQKKDGSWSFGGHDVGITALCTVALIENGVELTEPVIQDGYEFVQKKAKELKNTYDIALTIVLLQRVGDRKDRGTIRNLAARLVAGQLESGGWTYNCPGSEIDVEKTLRGAGLRLKDGFGDNSCTQFAVLGLWVASRNGVDIERTMKRVTERFEKHQTDDGGWSYGLDPKVAKQASSPSMTGAGLFCLAVAKAWEIRDAMREAAKSSKGDGKKAEADAARKSLLDNKYFQNGLKRTGEFSGGIGPGIGRYFLWSVERVGVLLALDKLGDVPWFERGSTALLQDQREDGSWPTAWADTDKDGLSDTCFALLFLRRANLGSDISRLLEGEFDEKFEIAGRQPAARFLKLNEAVAAAQPGETIRVNGNGPWRLGHLELDKDLTIIAGHGFNPIFKFEIGRNKKGSRFDPATEPEGRDMIAVKTGKVTIEGLRMQMDPAKDSKKVPWSVITVDGGDLRLLNCSVSETSQQGTAGVTWRSGGQLVLRNCEFIGGRTAVDVASTGDLDLVMDNSLTFGPSAITVSVPEAAATETDLHLRLRHSTFQVKEFLVVETSPRGLTVDAETSAFQGDWLSQNFLAIGKDPKKGREWKGRVNLYDVKNWVGTAGQAASIKDAKEWMKYWSNTETEIVKRKAPFVGTRRLGSYSHEANIQDWQLEFPTGTDAVFIRSRVGIISYVAGPGSAYDQYRESIGYTYWKARRLELSSRPTLTTDSLISWIMQSASHDFEVPNVLCP